MDLFLSHNIASLPLSLDAILVVSLAFCFYFVRWLLDEFIFTSLATWLCSKKSQKRRSLRIENSRRGPRFRVSTIDKATRDAIKKCSESMWKLTYYVAVQVCALKISYAEPWFWDTREYFNGWPDQELKLLVKLFYMSQCGFYIYSIAALLIWETRRKDFAVMMSHHVITVLLIGYSYMTRFFRIGSVILALHDASDVFLEAAKIFKYSEKELLASVSFGSFAISWVILRLIVFPFWVIKASSYHIGDFFDMSEPYIAMLYYVFNTMLFSLFVFHLYWWVLIQSMIMKQLRNRGRVGEDIRSDSDDDD